MYVFEDGTIVAGNDLLAKDLDNVVYVDELPPIEEKTGYIPVLRASVEEQRVWWEYEPIPKPPPTIEELQADIELLEDALLDLADMIL